MIFIHQDLWYGKLVQRGKPSHTILCSFSIHVGNNQIWKGIPVWWFDRRMSACKCQFLQWGSERSMSDDFYTCTLPNYRDKVIYWNACRFRWWPWCTVGCMCASVTRVLGVWSKSRSGNILSWRLIVKYFLQSFPKFSSTGSNSAVVYFLQKNVLKYWLND